MTRIVKNFNITDEMLNGYDVFCGGQVLIPADTVKLIAREYQSSHTGIGYHYLSPSDIIGIHHRVRSSIQIFGGEYDVPIVNTIWNTFLIDTTDLHKAITTIEHKLRNIDTVLSSCDNFLEKTTHIIVGLSYDKMSHAWRSVEALQSNVLMRKAKQRDKLKPYIFEALASLTWLCYVYYDAVVRFGETQPCIEMDTNE